MTETELRLKGERILGCLDKLRAKRAKEAKLEKKLENIATLMTLGVNPKEIQTIMPCKYGFAKYVTLKMKDGSRINKIPKNLVRI